MIDLENSYIIANKNPVLQPYAENLKKDFNICYVKNPEELNSVLHRQTPRYIFFFHWSWIIPENIFEKHECIVFHMTDLPYGRGGSPLQNLILLGHKRTKISAIRVEKGLDTGPVYLKKELDLSGSAHEIFDRAGALIEIMTREIIATQPTPIPQEGLPTIFKRRRPEQSNIATSEDLSLEKFYDFIRMLDAPNYPLAFVEFLDFKIEFFNSKFDITKEEIIANVRITKK